jgi:hypothetical protein
MFRTLPGMVCSASPSTGPTRPAKVAGFQTSSVKSNDKPGGAASSHRNPLQAFQWGDYGVTPGHRYRYRAQSLYGSPTQLRADESVAVEVSTERQGAGRHGIYFNRGVAGSQAYARRFADISPLESVEARRWLSRGLEEALLRFIDRAEGSDWKLRGACTSLSTSAS